MSSYPSKNITLFISATTNKVIFRGQLSPLPTLLSSPPSHARTYTRTHTHTHTKWWGIQTLRMLSMHQWVDYLYFTSYKRKIISKSGYWIPISNSGFVEHLLVTLSHNDKYRFQVTAKWQQLKTAYKISSNGNANMQLCTQMKVQHLFPLHPFHVVEHKFDLCLFNWWSWSKGLLLPNIPVSISSIHNTFS